MKFWDSSALVPLVIAEPSSDDLQREFERDPLIVVWWASSVECISALARREREAGNAGRIMVESLHRLDGLSKGWREVQPAERVREVARRVLRVHPLRAADALQLGAAIVAAEERPSTLPLVTLDDRLAQAALREGFEVVRPGAA